jgi:protein-S-isoprenylcysteine O-methyltransferase Ste14
VRRAFAILGTATFFVLAPCTVAGLVPWWISGWRFEPLGAAYLPVRILGGVLIVAGAIVLLDSFGRFALQGLGTPAPLFPTRHLVVSGWYRYVRNPMYVAVVSTVIGQGLMFANLWLLAYGAFVWLAFHLFVLAYEEPMLLATFAREYEEFRGAVPRWIPRLTPWSGKSS